MEPTKQQRQRADSKSRRSEAAAAEAREAIVGALLLLDGRILERLDYEARIKHRWIPSADEGTAERVRDSFARAAELRAGPEGVNGEPTLNDTDLAGIAVLRVDAAITPRGIALTRHLATPFVQLALALSMEAAPREMVEAGFARETLVSTIVRGRTAGRCVPRGQARSDLAFAQRKFKSWVREVVGPAMDGCDHRSRYIRGALKIGPMVGLGAGGDVASSAARLLARRHGIKLEPEEFESQVWIAGRERGWDGLIEFGPAGLVYTDAAVGTPRRESLRSITQRARKHGLEHSEEAESTEAKAASVDAVAAEGEARLALQALRREAEKRGPASLAAWKWEAGEGSRELLACQLGTTEKAVRNARDSWLRPELDRLKRRFG